MVKRQSVLKDNNPTTIAEGDTPTPSFNGFVPSENIVAYPISNRSGIYSISSRISTEYNITNLINQLKDIDSFVIKYVPNNSIDTSSDNSYIEFCMLGYYFKINHIDKYKINKEPLYASIKLDEQNITIGKFKYIQRDIDSIEGSTSIEGNNENNKVDLDSNDGGFYGLKLTNNIYSISNLYPKDYEYPRTVKLYFLQLFDSNGNVPFESQIKLITDKTHRSISIDDGDLDTQN